MNFVTNEKQTTIVAKLRRCWQQVVEWGHRSHTARKIYYGAYAIFFCGFLFFPSSKSHNNFFYVTLFLPSLVILRGLFSAFLKNTTFKLIIIYIAYLVLTNFWGVNVTLENIAEQIKHALYVLAFITASIVVESCYPEKADRLLLMLAVVATISFLLSILWWYHAHDFPAHRLRDALGRMRNPILAGCIAGLACLVLLDNLPKHNRHAMRIIVGVGVLINLAFIMLSQSRTALAALGPALLILAIPYLRRRAPVLILMGVIVAIVGFSLQDALITGFNRNSYRVDIWMATLDKAASSLWWGQGYFCDTTALEINGRVMRHAHNAYLAALRDGGLIGLLLLAGFVAIAIVHSWRQAQTSKGYLNLALIVFGALAVFFDNDRLVDNPEELWVFFWYPLCRIIAHDLGRDGLQGNPMPRPKRIT